MLNYTKTNKQTLTPMMTQSRCVAPLARGDELATATAAAHQVADEDPAAELAHMVGVQPAGDSLLAAPSTAANVSFNQKQSTLPGLISALPNSFDSVLKVLSHMNSSSGHRGWPTPSAPRGLAGQPPLQTYQRQATQSLAGDVYGGEVPDGDSVGATALEGWHRPGEVVALQLPQPLRRAAPPPSCSWQSP